MPTSLTELMTVYVDPNNGQFYVLWSKDVPIEWKMQFQAGFGNMFKEMPNDE